MFQPQLHYVDLQHANVQCVDLLAHVLCKLRQYCGHVPHIASWGTRIQIIAASKNHSQQPRESVVVHSQSWKATNYLHTNVCLCTLKDSCKEWHALNAARNSYIFESSWSAGLDLAKNCTSLTSATAEWRVSYRSSNAFLGFGLLNLHKVFCQLNFQLAHLQASVLEGPNLEPCSEGRHLRFKTLQSNLASLVRFSAPHLWTHTGSSAWLSRIVTVRK